MGRRALLVSGIVASLLYVVTCSLIAAALRAVERRLAIPR